MFEQARVILGSFPTITLLETEKYKVITVKKVSTFYYSVFNKTTGKRYPYRKIGAFERALRKNGIDKELLLDNMQSIILEQIAALNKEDLTKEDIDFFAIKKALFVPNQNVVIASNEVRSLILKGTDTTNYFEMHYYAKRKNKKILTAKVEIGCTEIFKMIKREELDAEKAINVLQSMLRQNYEAIFEQRKSGN